MDIFSRIQIESVEGHDRLPYSLDVMVLMVLVENLNGVRSGLVSPSPE